MRKGLNDNNNIYARAHTHQRKAATIIYLSGSQPERHVSAGGVNIPRGGQYSKGARALTRPTTWKVLSINSPINTFVFTTYFMSGGRETKDNYLREALQRKGVKNH